MQKQETMTTRPRADQPRTVAIVGAKETLIKLSLSTGV